MDHTVSLKTRSSGIEVYRLICMFFVIEGHVYLQFFPHPNEGGPVRTWLLLTTLIVTLTGLNNHGFMTISGYFGVEQNCDGTVLVCNGIFYTGIAVSVFKLTGI